MIEWIVVLATVIVIYICARYVHYALSGPSPEFIEKLGKGLEKMGYSKTEDSGPFIVYVRRKEAKG